jgi:hypothetical protein
MAALGTVAMQGSVQQRHAENHPNPNDTDALVLLLAPETVIDKGTRQSLVFISYLPNKNVAVTS